jgi:hypothetical protein
MVAKAEMITLRKRGRCYRSHYFLSIAIGKRKVACYRDLRGHLGPGPWDLPAWAGWAIPREGTVAADGERKGGGN